MKQYKIDFESVDGTTADNVFDPLGVATMLRRFALGYTLEAGTEKTVSSSPRRITIELVE